MTKPLTPEQIELFRRCGERILENHRLGRKVDPEALADAKVWAAYPKLQQPMGPGDVADTDLPPPLRNGALEVF